MSRFTLLLNIVVWINIVRITEATWEKRNLGVSAAEVQIDKDDEAETVAERINELNNQYIVVKLPVGRTDMLFRLQTIGFCFIEAMFETEINLKNAPVLPEVYHRFLAKTVYRESSSEEIEKVIKAVRDNQIFNTDRVALDPNFSVEMSARRYSYWIEDMMKSDNSIMQLSLYSNKIMGFNIFTDKETYYDGMLGGLMPEFRSSGLGIVNFYCGLMYLYEHGVKKYKAHVSSNNFQMFKLHTVSGMDVKSCEYCLVKHQ